jgi:hypothetical protein
MIHLVYSMCIVQLLRFFSSSAIFATWKPIMTPCCNLHLPLGEYNVCKSLLINCTDVSTVYFFPRAHKCKYLNFKQIFSTYCKFSCEQIFPSFDLFPVQFFPQCGNSSPCANSEMTKLLAWASAAYKLRSRPRGVNGKCTGWGGALVESNGFQLRRSSKRDFNMDCKFDRAVSVNLKYFIFSVASATLSYC